MSETINAPITFTATIVSNVQTSSEQNIIHKESINSCRTKSGSVDKQNEQKIQQVISENINSDKKLLHSKNNNDQILNEKFDKVNEKKFHVSSASLLPATLISSTAILSNNQNKSPKSETVNFKFFNIN